jgi:hypothetical protein
MVTVDSIWSPPPSPRPNANLPSLYRREIAANSRPTTARCSSPPRAEAGRTRVKRDGAALSFDFQRNRRASRRPGPISGNPASLARNEAQKPARSVPAAPSSCDSTARTAGVGTLSCLSAPQIQFWILSPETLSKCFALLVLQNPRRDLSLPAESEAHRVGVEHVLAHQANGSRRSASCPGGRGISSSHAPRQARKLSGQASTGSRMMREPSLRTRTSCCPSGNRQD